MATLSHSDIALRSLHSVCPLYAAPSDRLCNLVHNIDRKRQITKLQSQDEELRASSYNCAGSALTSVLFHQRSADKDHSIHGVGQQALAGI